MMVDFDLLTDETVRNLSRLLQVETVNPPGNEAPAIQIIKDILDQAGFPDQDYQILEAAPDRLNLVARLRGDGSQRPFLLSGHVDVVPVERERWSRDPFGGEVVDGFVWGRGAIDMKGPLAMYLAVFLEAFRQNLPLKRDLILAAIADEEAAFTYGSHFLVDKRPDLIDAEYGLTEAGALGVSLAGLRIYAIQVAEKSVCWLRMTSTGQPGHASMPHADNAVLHLSHAIDRIRCAGHLPYHMTPTMRNMLTGISQQARFPIGFLLGLMRSPALIGPILRLMPETSRNLFVALLSNTVAPTILNAGAKTNVIPSTAEASLDCRLLPGQTPEDGIREILAITGGKVKLEPITTSEGTEFPTNTPLFRALEKAARQMDPTGVVVPNLMPGATDASIYQRAGIKMYGFTPGILPEDFPWTKLAHGHDERLPVSAIRSGLPALWQVIREFCAT
jgi:acetylornithine deacetylase/succinyl-diaminopimelate desuccinylase-like protein